MDAIEETVKIINQMNTKTIYTIIVNNDELGLAGEVNEKLEVGWKCQGGISATAYVIDEMCYNIFNQAMTKEVPKE
jgi:hypothetical protein